MTTPQARPVKPGRLTALRRWLARQFIRLAYRVLLAYWFVARPQARGSYVAIWHRQRILIVKNSYKRLWTLPSGGIDRGETEQQAAIREVDEEVGIALNASQLRLVGRFVNDTEHKRDIVTLFEVELDAEPEITLDQIEVVAAGFMTREQALDRPLLPVLRDYLQSKTRV